MLSYHNFLVHKLNKLIGDVKAVQLSCTDIPKHTDSIAAIIEEIQLNKRHPRIKYETITSYGLFGEYLEKR